MNSISTLQLDYLAEIYRASVVEAQGQDMLIASSDLALRLGISQSTVNRMMERLRKAELIQHERYIGMQLTPKGQDVAVNLLRKQGIIEAFLHIVMKIEWNLVHDEAQQIRHGVDEKLLERMYMLSGQPKRSPYGEWIDVSHDSQLNELILSEAELKRDYTITSTLTRQADRLHYIEALGLKPDTTVKLLHKAPFQGPLQIQVGHEYRILGYELAESLVVVDAS
ncbi:MAG: metal-dependent transcriptional regulator [Chloroflexota bacterium]